MVNGDSSEDTSTNGTPITRRTALKLTGAAGGFLTGVGVGSGAVREQQQPTWPDKLELDYSYTKEWEYERKESHKSTEWEKNIRAVYSSNLEKIIEYDDRIVYYDVGPLGVSSIKHDETYELSYVDGPWRKSTTKYDGEGDQWFNAYFDVFPSSGTWTLEGPSVGYRALYESEDNRGNTEREQVSQHEYCLRVDGAIGTDGFESDTPVSGRNESPYNVSGGMGKRLATCTITSPCEVNQHDPLNDMSTFQSPGASGWRGAIYGCYRDGCRRPHRGWDLHAPVGTPVLAAASGWITHGEQRNSEGELAGWGNYIDLEDTTSNRMFKYTHLRNREPAGYYCAGEKIGEVGTTGSASAARPHLHIEVYEGGVRVNPDTVFPMPTRVVEQVGTQSTPIDFNAPAPCNPCNM